MKYVTFSRLGKHGRLGNQFFQIAATVGYALRTGRTCIFPLWKYNEHLKKPLPTGCVTPDVIYSQHGVECREIPLYDCETVDLKHYFESEKYFAHCKKEIRDLFTPSDRISEWILKELSEGPCCAVHVRRGDLLRLNKTPLMTCDYYRKGAEALYGPGYQDRRYIICSDDPDWCAGLPFKNKKIYRSYPDIKDLFLMSRCDDIIITTSTFSWWSAWLGSGRVISPSDWYLKLEDKHIWCEGWIRI